jgi:hypothetical protein
MERDMRHAIGKTFADPRLPATIRAGRRHAYARMYRMLAGSYRDVGEPKAMARSLARALSYEPSIGFELLTRLRPRRSIRERPLAKEHPDNRKVAGISRSTTVQRSEH